MIRVTIDYNRINNRMEQFKDKLYPAVKQQLKKGAHILVATPGRLVDLIEQGCCDLSGVLTRQRMTARRIRYMISDTHVISFMQTAAHLTMIFRTEPERYTHWQA